MLPDAFPIMTPQYDYYHHTIYDLATIYDFYASLRPCAPQPTAHAPRPMLGHCGVGVWSLPLEFL